jgi:hypothetical protein
MVTRKTCAALLGVLGLLACGAYAVQAARTDKKAARTSPTAPRIVAHPAAVTTSSTARFVVRAARLAGLRCKLDVSGERACARRVVYQRLGLGTHHFGVRVRGHRGRASRVRRFAWRIVEEQTGLSVTLPGDEGPTNASGPELYPGAPGRTIALRLTNPNGYPIFVTSVTVAVTDTPAGCGRENFDVTQPGVSDARPLPVSASSSITLPAGDVSAPSVRLLDLPVNQDPCKSVRVGFDATASAHS